jgi:hypothetical protein
VLFAAAMCTLLDEIAVALVALRMTRDLGANEALTAASLTAFSLGSLAGAVATDRMRAVLGVSALASAASLALVIAARSPLQAVAALFVLGASAAPHYPLLKAAAYDAVPGRPGLVNAAAQVFVVLDVSLPLALGMVAAQSGLGAALACLSAQSLFVLWGSIIACRRRAAAGDRR